MEELTFIDLPARCPAKRMDSESKFIIRKVLIDIVLLFCVGFPILYLFLWGKPYERGFFCDDESLKYPFHESTVTSGMLYVVGLAIPIMLVMVIEFITHRRKKNHKVYSFMGRRIPPWIWASYNIIGVFGFGVACQQLTTDIAKYSIGRLRPHFFDVCEPKDVCDLEINKYKYITQFECAGNNTRLIKEMRLSFPSGHSSFSTFTMIYLAIYLQCRLKWAGSKLLRHGLQFIALMLAWYTIMSRVSDYKHHWSDVLAGALIGAVTAFLIFYCVSDLWRRPSPPPVTPQSRDTSDILHPNNTSNGANGTV